MKNEKLIATLSLIGVIVVIVGNFIDNPTYWIFGDIYVGIILAIVSYMLFKDQFGEMNVVINVTLEFAKLYYKDYEINKLKFKFFSFG